MEFKDLHNLLTVLQNIEADLDETVTISLRGKDYTFKMIEMEENSSGKGWAQMSDEHFSLPTKVVLTGLKTQEVQDKARKATRAEEQWRESVDHQLKCIKNWVTADPYKEVFGSEATPAERICTLESQLAEALARIEELSKHIAYFDDFENRDGPRTMAQELRLVNDKLDNLKLNMIATQSRIEELEAGKDEQR